MKVKLLVLLMMVIFLTSCSSVPAKAKLPLPPALVVPKITLDEVSCLPESVKIKIKKRDQLKSKRIITLENTIKTTH